MVALQDSYSPSLYARPVTHSGTPDTSRLYPPFEVVAAGVLPIPTRFGLLASRSAPPPGLEVDQVTILERRRSHVFLVHKFKVLERRRSLLTWSGVSLFLLNVRYDFCTRL